MKSGHSDAEGNKKTGVLNRGKARGINNIMTQDPKNMLYYGDNLDVMRRHIKDDTVDLVYLDPPFNSNAITTFCLQRRTGPGQPARFEPSQIPGRRKAKPSKRTSIPEGGRSRTAGKRSGRFSENAT